MANQELVVMEGEAPLGFDTEQAVEERPFAYSTSVAGFDRRRHLVSIRHKTPTQPAWLSTGVDRRGQFVRGALKKGIRENPKILG